MSNAAHAIAMATQVSGTIVKMTPQQFQQVLNKTQSPVVVQSYGGVFSKSYQYLTSYKGLAFYTSSKERLPLPGSADIIDAKSVWVP